MSCRNGLPVWQRMLRAGDEEREGDHAALEAKNLWGKNLRKRRHMNVSEALVSRKRTRTPPHGTRTTQVGHSTKHFSHVPLGLSSSACWPIYSPYE